MISVPLCHLGTLITLELLFLRRSRKKTHILEIDTCMLVDILKNVVVFIQQFKIVMLSRPTIVFVSHNILMHIIIESYNAVPVYKWWAPMTHSIQLWLEIQRYLSPCHVGYVLSWLCINSDPNCEKVWSV